MNTKNVIIIILIAIIIMLTGTTLYLAMKNTGEQQITDQNDEPNKAIDTIPTGWKVYQNNKFKFSFAYPNSWTLNDLTDGDSNLLTLGMGTLGLGDHTAWVAVTSETDISKAIKARVTTIEKERKITLDTVEGKLVYSNGDRWVFVPYDSKVYSLGITYDVAPYNDDFNKILTTFKFLK